MDTQTAAALLPAFLIVTPLILAIIDRATIGKSETAMTGYAAASTAYAAPSTGGYTAPSNAGESRVSVAPR